MAPLEPKPPDPASFLPSLHLRCSILPKSYPSLSLFSASSACHASALRAIGPPLDYSRIDSESDSFWPPSTTDWSFLSVSLQFRHRILRSEFQFTVFCHLFPLGSDVVPAHSHPGKWWYGWFRYASLPCAPGNCRPIIWSDLLCVHQLGVLAVLGALSFLTFRHFRLFGFLWLSAIYLRWLFNLCAGSGMLDLWVCLAPCFVCVNLCFDLHLDLIAARLGSWYGFYGVLYLTIQAVVSNCAYHVAILLVIARDYNIHYVALLTLSHCCSYLAKYNCALIFSFGRPAAYPILSMVIRSDPFGFIRQARLVGFLCQYGLLVMRGFSFWGPCAMLCVQSLGSVLGGSHRWVLGLSLTACSSTPFFQSLFLRTSCVAYEEHVSKCRMCRLYMGMVGQSSKGGWFLIIVRTLRSSLVAAWVKHLLAWGLPSFWLSLFLDSLYVHMLGSFHRLCSQCLVHLIQWLLLPPYLGDLNISFMMRLFLHFSEAGGELCLSWVILLLLLSLCMVFQLCCYSGIGSMLLYNGLPCCFDSGYGRPLSCITLCFVLHSTMVVSCSGSGKGVIWGSYLCLVNLILTCHFAIVLLANNCPLKDYGPCLLHCISPYLLIDPTQHAMMFRIPDGMVANLHGGWCFTFLMRIFSSSIATWVALFVYWGLPLCWLSLLLGRLAAPKHDPLWSRFCWRLAVAQMVRDEEKGKPSVYEDFQSETAIAIAPVLVFSRDICLLFQWLETSTWHPYDWQTRWVASRMADCYRVFGATANSIVSFTSSLCCSVDMYCPCTLLFSFSFRLESPDMFVGRFQCNNGTVVRSIFGCCIPSFIICNVNIFRDLEQHLCVLGMYLLVLGPCLMALEQHRRMLGIACRGPGLCRTALAWHRLMAVYTHEGFDQCDGCRYCVNLIFQLLFWLLLIKKCNHYFVSILEQHIRVLGPCYKALDQHLRMLGPVFARFYYSYHYGTIYFYEMRSHENPSMECAGC